jgi:CheY-like chemotaxis protein
MVQILIVEDDVDLCETYLDLFQAEGHTVLTVHTGTDAIDTLIRRRFLPDVVILDLQLPGDSGIVVLGLIRRLPRLRLTKVIIASGQIEAGQWAVKQLGADLFLGKPIALDVLKRTIDDCATTRSAELRPIPPAGPDGPHSDHAPDGP